MKILMVSSEAVPYAKVGGLGDVVGALSVVLKRLGHDVRLAMPLYGDIQKNETFKVIDDNFKVHLGGYREEVATLWEANGATGVKTYFFEHPGYFGRKGIYGANGKGFEDNDKRFTFMCRAVLDTCKYLKWVPDVIHCHDWMTALIPIYLDTLERQTSLGQVATVLTIHNLEHQGIFGRELIAFAGLPDSVFNPECLESMGDINLLKGGLFKATKITAVSPNYAKEIQGSELGCGLNYILKRRHKDLVGILNGIDEVCWNPATDKNLQQMYSSTHLEGKKYCKKALQEHFDLPIEPATPVLGVVSRMYPQKGLDLLLDCIPSLMEKLSLQLVVVGNGESELEKRFLEMRDQYPKRMGVFIGYNEGLVHQVFGGSDFFLMPSRFEPCGLTQMYAMRYGVVPIARATGGLVDTVEPYKEGQLPSEVGELKGTGFLFQEMTSQAFYEAIASGVSLYSNPLNGYKKIQFNGMQKDFSWEKSAKKYEEVYEKAVRRRGG